MLECGQCGGRAQCTMRFGSIAKVLLKCKLKYYRISECSVRKPLLCISLDECHVYLWLLYRFNQAEGHLQAVGAVDNQGFHAHAAEAVQHLAAVQRLAHPGQDVRNLLQGDVHDVGHVQEAIIQHCSGPQTPCLSPNRLESARLALPFRGLIATRCFCSCQPQQLKILQACIPVQCPD